MNNNESQQYWWRNPYLTLLAFILFVVAFFEIAPFFLPKLHFCHSLIPEMALFNINFSASCLGGTVLYLALLPRRSKELWIFAILGFILDLLLIHERLNYIGIRGQILHIGVGFWPFAILAMALRFLGHWRRSERAEAQKAAEVLGLALAMPILYTCGNLATGTNMLIYDPMLMAADSMLGTQVSFHISSFMRSCLPLRLIGYFAYFYLAFFMIIAQLWCYKRTSEESDDIQPHVTPAWLYIITAVLGTSCYLFLPAIGTEAYCGTGIYPDGPIPTITSVPHTVEAPPQLERNCMPSLHLSWILCAFFAVSRLKKSYLYIGSVIAFLVWISAFSVGNHWTTDFLFSLPYIAMCLGLASFGATWPRRLTAILVGGLCFIGLVCLVKYDIAWIMTHRALYLSAVALIDIVSWILCLRLLPSRS